MIFSECLYASVSQPDWCLRHYESCLVVATTLDAFTAQLGLRDQHLKLAAAGTISACTLVSTEKPS